MSKGGVRTSTGVLVAALSLTALTVALLQTAVVPVARHHRSPAERVVGRGELGG